jgi:ribosomal protein S18 acetylase RimI-like enzyme
MGMTRGGTARVNKEVRLHEIGSMGCRQSLKRTRRHCHIGMREGTMISIEKIHKSKSERCREVLDNLPEWFGIPEATEAYVKASSDLPMFGAFAGDALAGFVSIKQHTASAAELYVMGVKKQFHRHGVGRRLVEAAADDARRSGLLFLTVKTLAPSNPDANYAATRKFYDAVGFVPLEVFPTLWDEENPCLLMIKSLSWRQ